MRMVKKFCNLTHTYLNINITIVIIVSFINSLANSNDTFIRRTVMHFTTNNSYNTLINSFMT